MLNKDSGWYLKRYAEPKVKVGFEESPLFLCLVTASFTRDYCSILHVSEIKSECDMPLCIALTHVRFAPVVLWFVNGCVDLLDDKQL